MNILLQCRVTIITWIFGHRITGCWKNCTEYGSVVFARIDSVFMYTSASHIATTEPNNGLPTFLAYIAM